MASKEKLALAKVTDEHIKELMKVLKKDPNADDYTLQYKETEQYLRELIEKNGSVLHGLIGAMERYLEN